MIDNKMSTLDTTIKGNPLISILVPVYGVEKYIERCTRSLFEQTYTNLEFVFVDDASPDKSVEILQQVITQYPKWNGQIKIIHHDKNLGLAATRNTLVDNSHGDFLLYVDSDDWIEPEAVELLLKRQMETGADIVTGSFYQHSFNGDREVHMEEKDREETLKDMLKIGSVVATWNRLIRSSLFHKHHIRFVEGINAGEDLLVTPRLVYFSQKVASCNAITYHYNKNNSNSYVNLFPHNWDLQQQLLRAVLLNMDFFKDKESFLSEAMNIQLAQRLKRVLNLTLKDHNRHGYKTVLSMLDDLPPKYWPQIGWNRLRRRWVDHHYFIAGIWMPPKKIRRMIQKA